MKPLQTYWNMADLITIQDGHDEIYVFVIVLETCTWLDNTPEHDFCHIHVVYIQQKKEG